MNKIIMNDTEIILKALSQDMPKKRKKLTLRTIEEPDICPISNNDPIIKLASKLKPKIEKKRSKNIKQWSNMDYIKYLNEALAIQDIQMTYHSNKDSEWIAKIHDKLLISLGDKMSDVTLKNYLDWWVSSFSTIYRDKKIHIAFLFHDNIINKFLKYISCDKESVSKKEEPKQKDEVIVDENKIYQLGGLQMLLMSRGIVNSVKFLSKSSESIDKISSLLRQLPSIVLKSILDTTMNFAPYNETDKIDFFAISRPALTYHGIKDYDKQDYKRFFN